MGLSTKMGTENQSNTAKDSKEKSDQDKQNTEWRNRIYSSRFFNNKPENETEKWGYDLYPERKQLFKSTFSKILQMQEGREQFDKIRCEENVYECAKSSPLVKIMMGALKSAGW